MYVVLRCGLKSKARFSRRHPAWKWRGPILILALHTFVICLDTYRLTSSPGTYTWLFHHVIFFPELLEIRMRPLRFAQQDVYLPNNSDKSTERCRCRMKTDRITTSCPTLQSSNQQQCSNNQTPSPTGNFALNGMNVSTDVAERRQRQTQLISDIPDDKNSRRTVCFNVTIIYHGNAITLCECSKQQKAQRKTKLTWQHVQHCTDLSCSASDWCAQCRQHRWLPSLMLERTAHTSASDLCQCLHMVSKSILELDV